MLSRLPLICGVAFVKKSYVKNGILIAHEGFVIDKKFLVHASSSSKKTVKEDLLSYLNSKKESKFDDFQGTIEDKKSQIVSIINKDD